MGKVGYLPDISGNFVHWRMEYEEGRETGNWGKVSLGLHNMNGSLDIDYRLPISTELWNKKQDGYIIWECENCTEKVKKVLNEGEDNEKVKYYDRPTRSKKSEVRVFNVRCTFVQQVLSGKTHRKLWECPKCNNIAPVKKVSAKLMKYPEPHYRGCIYDEPKRPNTGLQRRRGSYPREMIAWSKAFSIELEHQLAIYRLEYIRVNGKDMEDAIGTGYVDKGGN